MASRRLLTALVVGVPAALAVALLVLAAPPMGDTDYDQATVTVVDDNGTTLGTVEVRIADTQRERYVGLSETASLGPDEGMLFVYETAGDRAYVMRNMSFPLDIVFVGGDRHITRIHHAPVPENTESEGLIRYRGRARWVLEVRYNWTRAHGVSVGDRIRIRRNG